MDPGGQRGSSNPAAMLASLLNKRAKLHEDLRNIEKQVYDLETSYLQDPGQCGNVLKGFEGFLSSSKNTALLKRSRKFQPEDRLFSLSSVTSPAMLPALVMSVIRVSTGAFRLAAFLYVDPLTYQTTFNFVYIIQNLGHLEICSNVLYFSCTLRFSRLKNKQLDEMMGDQNLEEVDPRVEAYTQTDSEGKPKKGRGASRDSKKIRPSADPDFDYDDDAALTL
ncbi:hypothetical protein OIU85_018441 [Salix viminalis]|uniref:Chromatin modification-related protein MEAF6 n=1 Tax=Salix viminalis TaxID=40686 RepID=A0A9Q0UUE5_SALVM|nr:hypothetical protein OIU85_018441 [Salix viminalis]